MAIETKHEELQGIRIRPVERGDAGGETPAWGGREILIGIAIVVLGYEPCQLWPTGCFPGEWTR